MKKIFLGTTLFLLVLLNNIKGQAIDKKLLKKVAEAEKEASKLPSEGITGEIHKNNIGKILFSSLHVKRETMNSDATQYRNSFLLGEPIYGRVFLAKGINQYMLVSGFKAGDYVKPNYDDYIKKSMADILMYVDGQLLVTSPITIQYPKNEQDAFITTCELNIVNSKADGSMMKYFVDALNKISVGKHIIKIEFWGVYNSFKSIEPMASGEFTMEVKENTKAKIGVSFDDVKAGMVNKDLEAKILVAAKENADLNKREEIYLQTKIIEKDWIIMRNKYSGIITERRVYANILQKWPKGNCSYRSFYVRETHDGTIYLGDYFATPHGDEVDCDCP